LAPPQQETAAITTAGATTTCIAVCFCCECMGNRNSSTGSPSRKQSHNDMIRADASTSTSTSTSENEADEVVASIQHDLQEVESGLSSPRHTVPGRTVFDLIGSALGSIRSRLQDVSSSSGNNKNKNNNNRAAAFASVSASASNTIHCSLVALSERLRVAERAHTARIPLGMLRRELSHRESSGNGDGGDSKSSSPDADATATAAPLKEAVDAKEQEEESQNNRNGRKPSTLEASRKYAESQHNLDVELHEGGVGISLPFEEPMDVSERSEDDFLLTKASLQHVDKDNNLMGSLLSSLSLEGLPLVLVAAGHQHAVVVTAHGTAFAWGSNTQGACGRECPNTLTVPVPINVTPSSITPVSHPATLLGCTILMLIGTKRYLSGMRK
jgi:hypothetical protein